MLIFPAIDLIDGKAVRLFKGDYAQKTVYSDNPVSIARDFYAAGARCIHLVDLDGAKTGETPNLALVSEIANSTGMFTEIGGGIRSMETVRGYLHAGLDRVIIGTAAVNDPDFLAQVLAEFGSRVAVGVDVRDGKVAIKGWLEQSCYGVDEFCAKMQEMGVQTIICTDISKDGALAGTNRDLYRDLMQKYSMDITASGGVSSIDDVMALRDMGMYGAIIGKAYYEGAISLEEACRAAGSQE